MSDEKHLSKDDIAAIIREIEGRVTNSLNRRMAREGKQIQDQIKGLETSMLDFLEILKHELLRAVRENDQSLEVIAREMARWDANRPKKADKA
jgi:hypothetical protein